ncbi:LPS export ABC transporter permease LptF [Flocculibacter collagenilyticus]|uniref:LPS export ABC transporter permease LptF n=1 Tax=Flocculibacter collagenilyticus TaxID=2744479 RepID=UPI0018F54835|nr:LPS export ABC transporter permease LptF [Flocculibacter collagenilyticus]
MIIFRYLIAEVFKAQLAVFLVLMTIFVSQKFVKILGDASEGELPGQLVMSIIAFKLPQLAGLILPLSVFLGILLAYGRIYADSEMSVLHACGVSEWYVTRVTLIFALILSMITGGVTLFVAPWAAEQEYQVRDKADADTGLSSIISGRFQVSGNKKAVIFVEDINRQGNMLNRVFVAQMPQIGEADDRTTVVYAERGDIAEEATGAQKLVLHNGKQYQNSLGDQQFQKIEFSEYQIQIREQEVEQRRRKLSAVPTAKLLEGPLTPEIMAELHWRLSIPISIILLTLIAVPMSSVQPRQGKFAKMLPALGLYLGYFILLIAGRSAIEDGKIPPHIGLWWIHITALFIGAFLIIRGRPLGSKLRAKVKRRPA